MTTTVKTFLSENKQEVITFYNDKVQGLYDVSLKDFMTDLLNNFRKITTGEDLKRFDLMGNLDEAKSRIGMFSHSIENTYSKPYSESNHAKMVNYHGTEKAAQLSRI